MMRIFRLLSRHCIAAACIFLLAACSATPSKIPENLSDATLYDKGQKALNRKDYFVAIDNFKALESRYPFGPFSTQGQLYLAYAYLENDDPENAHAAASRFIRLHPDHPGADYAYYIKGLSSYMSNQGFVEKYLPVDPSQRDAGQTLQAFNEFSELLSKFPDSRYVPDARQRMIAIRNRMARHLLHIATYYMKRHAYVAAINRGNEIISGYPNTPLVENALGIVIEGYQHLGMMQPAGEALNTLKKNFPHTKLVNKDGNFTGYQTFSDVDPSFWNTVTFGLVGGNQDKTINEGKVPTPPAK